MTGDEARQIREQLGLSVTQLARILGLAKNGDDAVRNWERGRSSVKGPTALALRYMARYGLPDEALSETIPARSRSPSGRAA